ncbi:MAG TPA: alpha/beta fold hydrolase [Acidobacteriota bacterium]|nr:alpha/beta fold hydrolase [Acidobacteriota bacterium]
MSNEASIIKRHPVLSYYILTFLISYGTLLFLLLRSGLPANRQEMNEAILLAIPFMLLGPSLSGLLMTGLVDGRAGFRDLWQRLRRWRVGAGWYALALLLPVAISLAVPMVLSLFSPEYLPGIFAATDKTSRLIMNLTAGVAVGICEEVGWMGFVAPKLRQSYDSAKTGLIMGVMWGLWHILPMAVMPSVAYGAPAAPGTYVALRSVYFLVGGLVAFRVLMLWLYDNTQSLFIMAVLHAALTSANMLFAPNTTGMANFAFDLANTIVTWLMVAVVLSVGRGRMRIPTKATPHPSWRTPEGRRKLLGNGLEAMVMGREDPRQVDEHRRRRRRLKMFALTITLLLVLSLFMFIGAVCINSSSRPKPFVDKDGRPLAGSISEKAFVDINGARQGMFIKGRSFSNPVLLYLHGGMPDFFLTQGHPTGLEDHFTVVWWEQRGAGISYAGDIDPKTLNSRQLIEDTKSLSRYLCQRFGREKIYLMGHSGGSFIGLQATAEAPELYHAYIGVAQMVDQRASEKEAYDYMLRLFEKAGDKGMARQLGRAPVHRQGDIPRAYLAVRDKAMHRLGVGTKHTMRSVFSGLFIPSLFFKEYSISDKIKLWKAKAKAGLSVISDEILTTDLSRRVTRLEVPFYVFHGSMDHTVSYALSKAYFERMEAPQKGFYTFAHSAHCPLFEEPQKMIRILVRDVLKNDHILSDP